MDAHKGTLTVFSAGEGCGTTFTVSVPMSLDTSPRPALSIHASSIVFPINHTQDGLVEAMEESSVAVGGGRGSRAARKCILTVDDSILSRKMVRRLLSTDYGIVEAEDGAIAVDKVKTSLEGAGAVFDLILMDYQMPNMDGPTAISRIRALGFAGPIIGLTGNALECDRITLLSAGANNVLTKPVDPEELEKVIAACLSR